MNSNYDLVNCLCGGKPKVKYAAPYTWVECKKCHKRSQAFSDVYGNQDVEAQRDAILNWNQSNDIGVE